MTSDQYATLRAGLPEEQRPLLDRLETLMTGVIGSREAYLLWLDCPIPGYRTTPSDVILADGPARVLDIEESQHGPGYNPA